MQARYFKRKKGPPLAAPFYSLHFEMGGKKRLHWWFFLTEHPSGGALLKHLFALFYFLFDPEHIFIEAALGDRPLNKPGYGN